MVYMSPSCLEGSDCQYMYFSLSLSLSGDTSIITHKHTHRIQQQQETVCFFGSTPNSTVSSDLPFFRFVQICS